jgi:hypothetical protein
VQPPLLLAYNLLLDNHAPTKCHLLCTSPLNITSACTAPKPLLRLYIYRSCFRHSSSPHLACCVVEAVKEAVHTTSPVRATQRADSRTMKPYASLAPSRCQEKQQCYTHTASHQAARPDSSIDVNSHRNNVLTLNSPSLFKHLLIHSPPLTCIRLTNVRIIRSSWLMASRKSDAILRPSTLRDR